MNDIDNNQGISSQKPDYHVVRIFQSVAECNNEAYEKLLVIKGKVKMMTSPWVCWCRFQTHTLQCLDPEA